MNDSEAACGGAAHKVAALTIAGFDPSSGAGMTADLLVFAAHRIFATSAITALTVQSTLGVRSVHSVPASVLADTLACLESDLPPAGIKIGMLADETHVGVVADYLSGVRAHRAVTVVLDPVLRSSSGAVLLNEAGVDLLRARLLPLVDVITPNLREAEVLSDQPCRTRAEMEACALHLGSRYPNLSVVVTGGHLETPSDLWCGEDGMDWIDGTRVETSATHGTGCAFSSALLAARLQGRSWRQAVPYAKQYVHHAMLTATPRGQGQGPMNLLAMPHLRVS